MYGVDTLLLFPVLASKFSEFYSLQDHLSFGLQLQVFSEQVINRNEFVHWHIGLSMQETSGNVFAISKIITVTLDIEPYISEITLSKMFTLWEWYIVCRYCLAMCELRTVRRIDTLVFRIYSHLGLTLHGSSEGPVTDPNKTCSWRDVLTLIKTNREYISYIYIYISYRLKIKRFHYQTLNLTKKMKMFQSLRHHLM